MKNYVMALVMILAVSGLAFGQTGVSTVCDDPCYVAPYFKGTGGFVGQQHMEDDEATMGTDEGAVDFVVTCGNVTTTGTPAVDDMGIVRQLFNEENGLACGEADGKIEISNLEPGGWYWIHDEVNAAVSSLVNAKVLMNAQVEPTDPGGVTITKMGETGAASFVKHEPSGRVGIIPHLHPTEPMPLCSSEVKNKCEVNASYSIVLENGAGKEIGATVTRGDDEIVITPKVSPMGNLADGEGVTFSAELASGLGITEASGTVTIEALAPTNDKSRCYDDNIDRDTPVAVTVKADVSAATGYVPAPADAGGIKSVSFNVVCPAVQEASSTQGQELVPENPFPTDR